MIIQNTTPAILVNIMMLVVGVETTQNGNLAKDGKGEKMSELQKRIEKSIMSGSYYFSQSTKDAWGSEIHEDTYDSGFFIETVNGWDGKRKHHILFIDEEGNIKKLKNPIWFNDLRPAKKKIKEIIKCNCEMVDV